MSIRESEYIPVSKREGITDPHLVIILDYLERHTKVFVYIDERIIIDRKFYIDFSGAYIYIYSDTHTITVLPKKILAENIVGIYGSLKHIS